MFKKVWRDPVWSAVIAAVILGVGGSVWAFASEIWGVVSTWPGAARDFLFAVTEVPNWLLAILSLCGVAVLALMGLLAWVAVFDRKGPATPLSYTQDTIFNIRWRWRLASDGTIYNLASFCPYCDLQIHPTNVGTYRVIDHIAYRCEDCGTVLKEFDMWVDMIEDRVIRQIQKKIRTEIIPSLQAH